MELAEAKRKFSEFLKKEKHRITPERFEVLDYALDLGGHFVADDLFIEMKKNNSSVSRATVYNTIELLEQCNLIAKRHFGDNKAHYESLFKRKNHDHIICSNTGEIIEFTSPEIREIVDQICEKYEVESTGYSFNIYGICRRGKYEKEKA